MSANNLYRGLFELLTAPHGDAASAIILASGRTARRELLSVARKEDCLPELYARWAAADQLSPTEHDEHEQLTRQRASTVDVLRVLPAGSLLAGASGFQSGWPTLTVLLRDFGAIGALHEAVRGLGYRLHGSGEWLVPLRDPMHRGVAAYRYAMAGRPEQAIAIEVQVAGVALDARRNLAFADLADQATRLDGFACRTLAPTRQLLHRIATFGARPGPVTVREIADIHLLLKDPAHAIDHAWLHGKVEQLGAWNGLGKLRDAIVSTRLSPALSWGEFGRLIELSAARDQAADTRRSLTPRAAALLKSAFDLVPGPREDDIAAKLARTPWLVSRALGAGYRVCGVPVSSKAFDVPRFLRIDGALYLATGAGLILLSLVDLGEDARAKQGERVRTGSRPVVLARWSAAKSSRKVGAHSR